MKNNLIRKIAIHLCSIFLFAQIATAKSTIPISNLTAPVRHAQAPLRFKTFSSYLQYLSIKALKGSDSAAAFYRKEFRNSAFDCPCLSLSGGELTGALSGSSAYFSSTFSVSGTSTFGLANFSNAVTISRASTAGGSLVINRTSSSYAATTLYQDNSSNRWAVGTDGDGTADFKFYNHASGNYSLKLGYGTDLATFVGSATFGGSISGGTVNFGLGNFSNAVTISRASTAGGSLVINRTSSSYAATTLYQDNSSNRWAVGTDGDGTADFKFYNHASGNYSLKLGYGNDSATFAGNARFVGNVTIGAPTNSLEKLSVNGNIRAKKLIVTQIGWTDYVFAKEYKLRSLSSLETFIKQNKHLPEIPSAKKVEKNGINVGDNQALLLKKIEELTLYMIGQQKQINNLANEIKRIKTKK